MKDVNGFYLDIAKTNVPIPHDMEAIRMNLDDFTFWIRYKSGAAYASRIACGFSVPLEQWGLLWESGHFLICLIR